MEALIAPKVTAKNVTIIPRTVDNLKLTPIKSLAKKKVAAYARVSTDMEEQATSYEAQVNYYENYIKRNKEWEFCGIYADEGLSGTSIKKRDGFNRMINDALNGKIDLIITKSISRFARNTVDSLTTIRKLKEKNIEVFFEKENIGTLDGKGELLLSIMSSISQEESRSISLNTTWGIRKQFADGKVKMATKNFLGYDMVDGKLVINKKQAEVVKLIYRMFIVGNSIYSIKKELERNDIPSPGGSKKWSVTTIKSILTNEKFKGDALLQKQYTADFLTKKRKYNKGEIPQYYVSDDHEAIIDKKTFDAIQVDIPKRCGKSGNNLFLNKVVCGECGSVFGRKLWHSNDKYRKYVLRCNAKYKNDCNSGTVTEEEVKDFFIECFNKLNKKECLKDIELMKEALGDLTKENNEIEKIQNEILKIVTQDDEVIEMFNTGKIDTLEQHEKLAKEHEVLTHKLNKVNERIAEKKDKLKTLDNFARDVCGISGKLKEFNQELLVILVDRIEVHKGKLVLVWKDGKYEEKTL